MVSLNLLNVFILTKFTLQNKQNPNKIKIIEWPEIVKQITIWRKEK